MRRGAAPADEGGALSLRSWFAEAEAAASIAAQVCDTPFVPDSLKVWTNPAEKDPAKRVLDTDATIATVTAALLAGQELGFSPMASLRSMDVIKGTPALRAIALRALVQAHGHDIVVVKSNTTIAVVRGCRAGGQVQESTWTLDRAKLLGLYPGPEYGNWRKQPQSQLVARATAEVARWVAADSILGLPYIAEELADGYDPGAGDLGAGDGADGDAAGTTAAAGAPSRASKRRAPRALPAPVVPMPRPAEPEPPTPKITATQVRALNGVLRTLNIRNRADEAAAVRRYVDREIANADDLTFDEAVRVLTALTDEAARLRAEQDEAPGHDDPGAADDEGGQSDDARE